MKLLTTNWAQWSLVLTAVALLTALHRLDLLAIVAPLAVVVGYAITLAKRRANSSGRRI
jgi:hypothetical protein